MTRKLLILTYHFPPCAAVAVHRMVGLVRHLPASDWRSVVVAPPNPPYEPSDPGLLKSVPADSTTVISVPFAEGLWGKINRKFAPGLLWNWQAKRACVRAIREHKPDAILTSMPPHSVHEIGLALKKRFGLPWIADFRDPWFVLSSTLTGGPRDQITARKERETIDAADCVVGISPLYTEGLKKAYSEHAHKILTITNGYEPETFAETLVPPSRERLSILYTGELYFGRDPRAFLDAMRELHGSPDAPKVGFDFLGRWTDKHDLPTLVKERGLESIVNVGGLVPYRECLRTMMQADILLLIHTPGYTHGLPAKIFEYLGARRPILVLTEHSGDIGWVLKESGVLHRIAPMGNAAAIKQAIAELATAVRNGEPVTAGDKGVSFTRAAMAQRFAEQLDSIAPRRWTSPGAPGEARGSNLQSPQSPLAPGFAKGMEVSSR
jgi:glycosyltransferase involved in cell wall biosynthesis